MRRLLRYLRRYRLRYAAGGACLLGTATLAMAVPYLLKRGVEAIERGDDLTHVAWFALAIAAVASVQGVVRTASRALIFNVGRDVEYDIRNDLFAHLLRLPQSYFQRQSTGDLMSRLINDVQAVRLLLGPGVLNLVNTPLYYAYGLTIMFSLDPVMTLLALSPFPILLLGVKRVSRRLMEDTLRVQDGLSELSALVQENVAGMHVVKAYAAEDLAVERFARANTDFARRNLDLARVRGALVPLARLSSAAGTLVILAWGGRAVIRGALGLGDLVAFIGYLNLLAWPTMAMGWMLSILQRGRAAMRRLDAIFAVEPEIRDPEPPRFLERPRGEVRWEDVDFGYSHTGDGSPVLERVSLTVPAGSCLAVVGRTGAGKSSLVQLLPRLWDPVRGRVMVDGHDVRELALRSLRRAVGLVPQDPFLFSTTVRANIAFGREDASEAEIEAAARAAGIHEEILAMPRGYDTIVGERGITLSGGQKQRITLARALLYNPPILVLDDALSSVDVRTERRILASLSTYTRHRTCVIISHRLSAIRHADRIAVIDHGSLVELGEHEGLLERGGVYADLFRRQQLEEELEEL